MRIGIDAAFAGSTADFDEAAKAGVEWVGEYFGGSGCFHVWTNNDRAALAASKIPYRLPIWVPDQMFTSNPVEEAKQAIGTHQALGFRQVIALDAERGSGYTTAWGESFGATLRENGLDMVLYHGGAVAPSIAADWLAFWTGNAPNSLGSRKAQQYRGNTASYGMSVDFDAAADDFPLEGLTQTTSTGGSNVDVNGFPKGKLNGPVLCHGELSTKDGGWLVGADGGIFTWGRAHFYGSAAHLKLAGPITGIVVAADDKGYTLIGSDGGTFVYGSGPKIPSLA